MTECRDTQRTIPMIKVVSGAMIDAYEDVSKAGIQQMYFHWAARGFRKLNNEVLRVGKKNVLLRINKNTSTATLPLDFGEECFVGGIDNYGRKVPFLINTNFTDTNSITDLACEDKCPKCNQNKGICKDMSITEDSVIVVINGSTYEQTITKKLYPNGDYYLETKIPVLNISTGVVEYTTQKEFITSLSLKPCGCIDETEKNIEKIKCNSYSTYCSYFSECGEVDVNSSYQIFEETGLIKFNSNIAYDKCYLEYWGYLPKKNGQYHVPEICFETLVNWIKYKSVENKRNISLSERNWFLENYKRERRNMEILIARKGISFKGILQAAMSLPKFDFINPIIDDDCRIEPPSSLPNNATEEVCSSQPTCPPTSTKSFQPFDIAVIAGNGAGTPTAGVNTYQNDKLIGAVGVNNIIVNNNNESAIKNEFVLDTVLGKITRYQGDGVTPNNWFAGDSLIITTFFKLV